MIAWWMRELILVRWSHGGSLDEIRWSDLMSARCYQPINSNGEKMQDLSRPLAVAITSFEGWFDDVGSQGCDSALACSHEQLKWPFKALVVVACLRKKKMEVFESPLMKTRWMTRECSTSMVWYRWVRWPFEVFGCCRWLASWVWDAASAWCEASSWCDLLRPLFVAVGWRTIKMSWGCSISVVWYYWLWSSTLFGDFGLSMEVSWCQGVVVSLLSMVLRAMTKTWWGALAGFERLVDEFSCGTLQRLTSFGMLLRRRHWRLVTCKPYSNSRLHGETLVGIEQL